MCDRALSSGPMTGIGIVFGGGGTVRSSVPRSAGLEVQRLEHQAGGGHERLGGRQHDVGDVDLLGVELWRPTGRW